MYLEGFKVCSICKNKNVKFSKDKRAKDGFSSECNYCHSKRSKTDNYAPKRKEIVRKSSYKKNYGITIEDYDLMFKKQNGKCAICGTKSPGRGNAHFSIDHDHKTDRVRGLLCDNCNKGFGHFKESIDNFLKAIEYKNKSMLFNSDKG